MGRATERVEDALAQPGDPVECWLQWEEQANLIGFRTSTEPVPIEVASVQRSALEVRVPNRAPRAIVGRFLRGERVLFPKHPLNRDASVAFFEAPIAELWLARYTSSRTLVVPEAAGAALFSVKLATDHPHPDFHQPEKTRLREEAADAIEWVNLLDRVDALLGPAPSLHVVRESLAVLVAGSETGFLVRDLRSFRDGHYYLPALSIPWVGRQIAQRHGEPFDSFWGRHYAGAAGRAKGTLLARSGLQFETPNPQNVLVQLDAALRPTGRMVVRDLGDARCVTDARRCRGVPWTRLVEDLRPETHNSFWAFGEAGSHAVDAATLEAWYDRHDAGYFGALAAHFPELGPERADTPRAAYAHWNAALRDPAAAPLLRAAFARLRPARRG
jgi:hypothetical protein